MTDCTEPMARKYDSLGRSAGFQVGTGGETPDPDADYDITYHYGQLIILGTGTDY